MKDFLATVEDLERRIGEPIEEAEDLALAEALLRRASARARHYGRDGWTRYTAPEVVITAVIEAAARGYDNPAGYEMERGDMLTVQRGAAAAGGVQFTKDEMLEIRSAAGRSGFYSITVTRPDVMSDVNVRGGAGGASVPGN